MWLGRWEAYIAPLRDEYRSQSPEDRLYFFRDYGRFKDFVAQLPQDDKVPLLIHAYEHYRDFEASTDSESDRFFWSSAYAILIARLLAAKLKPTDAEACLILAVACRRIASAGSLLQPIEIAERVFRHRAYPADLFDSARAYRDTLAVADSAEARKARKTLDLMTWHDVRQPNRGCWSSCVQKSIAAMPAVEALAWQLLLRHAPAGIGKPSAGKPWRQEAQRRLAAVGEQRFLDRIEQWFRFPDAGAVRLSIPGNHYLSLLVLFCGLTDRARTVPILNRLIAARWSERGRMKKVVDGLVRSGLAGAAIDTPER